MLPPRLRLRTKISLHFLGLLLLWSVPLIALQKFYLERTARGFFIESGAQMTRALALSCARFAYYEDLAGIDRLLLGERREHSFIKYLAVFDDAGAPLWSTFPGAVPRDLLALDHEPIGDENVRGRLVRADGELLYDYRVAQGGICLRMGVSLNPVEEPVRRAMTHVLWLAAVGFVAVCALALSVSRPVEALTGAIERAVQLDASLGPAPARSATRETRLIEKNFSELLTRLEERTRQLDGSRKLAYLGEISAGIAHEVNNPLGVLVMNSDFLARRAQAGELPAGAVCEVDRVQRAARRAGLAMQKLLQFARYSLGDGRTPRRPVDLGALVRETVDLLEDRIRQCGCNARLEVATDLPLVTCDEQGMQQVLFNLLTNALDASPQGGDLTIRVWRAGARAFCAVADTGEGMNEEVLRRAREPFFTTKEPGRGSGLGLSSSESIVRAHGGELGIESAPGRGTKVTVWLPLEEDAG
ncbi:MAG: hypothetical protein HZA54_19045 [Planctomycetes bacterium]|nr:hypothetical protein [Planctomycetota bacterium]